MSCYFDSVSYFQALSSNEGYEIKKNTQGDFKHSFCDKVTQSCSAEDPFNFDADPDLDPGSTLEKNESGSRAFL